MLRTARDITADLVDLGGEAVAALAIGTVTTLSTALGASSTRASISRRERRREVLPVAREVPTTATSTNARRNQ